MEKGRRSLGAWYRKLEEDCARLNRVGLCYSVGLGQVRLVQVIMLNAEQRRAWKRREQSIVERRGGRTSTPGVGILCRIPTRRVYDDNPFCVPNTKRLATTIRLLLLFLLSILFGWELVLKRGRWSKWNDALIRMLYTLWTGHNQITQTSDIQVSLKDCQPGVLEDFFNLFRLHINVGIFKNSEGKEKKEGRKQGISSIKNISLTVPRRLVNRIFRD